MILMFFVTNPAMKLAKNTRINEYDIEPIDNKQSSYGLIYPISQIELETLKTYIKTHLTTAFI